MFSRTTIASSIRIPIASDRPRRDIVFSVKPKIASGTNDVSTDTGSARPVITVDRQELRNRNTTRTVSNAPSTNASSTLRTEWRTRSPASRTTSSLVPAGSVFCSCAMRALTRSATAVVLYSRDLTMSNPIACVPLNSAADVGSAAPACTIAT